MDAIYIMINKLNNNKKQVLDLLLVYFNINLVLILISIGLVAIIAFFVVKYLKCLDKSDNFIIIRFNVKWKNDIY